jgi:hypothetical protein
MRQCGADLGMRCIPPQVATCSAGDGGADVLRVVGRAEHKGRHAGELGDQSPDRDDPGVDRALRTDQHDVRLFVWVAFEQLLTRRDGVDSSHAGYRGHELPEALADPSSFVADENAGHLVLLAPKESADSLLVNTVCNEASCGLIFGPFEWDSPFAQPICPVCRIIYYPFG